MKIFVLFAETTTNCDGTVLESGKVNGVYLTYDDAKAALDKVTDTYTRRKSEWDIVEQTVG